MRHQSMQREIFAGHDDTKFSIFMLSLPGASWDLGRVTKEFKQESLFRKTHSSGIVFHASVTRDKRCRAPPSIDPRRSAAIMNVNYDLLGWERDCFHLSLRWIDWNIKNAHFYSNLICTSLKWVVHAQREANLIKPLFRTEPWAFQTNFSAVRILDVIVCWDRQQHTKTLPPGVVHSFRVSNVS